MSPTKKDESQTEKQSTTGGDLESQYRDIGISAVSAAAAYTRKSDKPSH